MFDCYRCSFPLVAGSSYLPVHRYNHVVSISMVAPWSKATHSVATKAAVRPLKCEILFVAAGQGFTLSQAEFSIQPFVQISVSVSVAKSLSKGYCFLVRFRKITGLNLDRDTCVDSVVFLSPSQQLPARYLRSDHDPFLSHTIQCISP